MIEKVNKFSSSRAEPNIAGRAPRTEWLIKDLTPEVRRRIEAAHRELGGGRRDDYQFHISRGHEKTKFFEANKERREMILAFTATIVAQT